MWCTSLEVPWQHHGRVKSFSDCCCTRGHQLPVRGVLRQGQRPCRCGDSVYASGPCCRDKALFEATHLCLLQEAEELLLDPSSSDGSFTSTSAHRAASQGPTGLGLLAAAATSLGPGSSRVSGAGPAPLGACLTSSRTTETGGRPLSPRSLLASAKAGSAFVNNSSLCGAGSLFCSPAGGLGWDASPAPQEASAMSIEDGREHEGSDVKLGSHVAAAGLHPQAPACVGTGSLELAQVNQQEVLQDWDKEEINSSSSSSSSPSSGGTTAPAAGAAAMRQDSGGSGASNTGTPGSKRRESLQRWASPSMATALMQYAHSCAR